MAALKEAAPITHISDIHCEFYNYNEHSENGDIISVKFDEQDSFIGALYTSGVIKVFNAFTGKVSHTLNAAPH